MEQDPIHRERTADAPLLGWGCLPVAVVLRCWEDPAYADRLRQHPRETLAAAGIVIDPGIDVRIVQNSPNTIHLAIPICPVPLRQADPTQLTPDKW